MARMPGRRRVMILVRFVKVAETWPGQHDQTRCAYRDGASIVNSVCGDGGALARQVCHPERPARRARRGLRVRRGRIEDVVHPDLSISAAIAWRGRGLVLAGALALGAPQAYMEMIVMAPPRPDLAKP